MEPLTPLFTEQISQPKFSSKEKGTQGWRAESQGPSPYRQKLAISLGAVCPGQWWGWVSNPGLHLKAKGTGSFPKGPRTPTPHELSLAKEQGCPSSHTAPVPLCLGLLPKACHGGSCYPLDCKPCPASVPTSRLTPPHHGCSEGQRWALLTRAVRPSSRIAPQHQMQPSAQREALLAG